MKILVSGASGFLGTNIVLQLLEKGYTIRAFSLEGSNTAYIDKPGVEMAFGNVAEPAAVDIVMDGVDAVIHTAGDTSFWKKRFERQRKTNVDGVHTVMNSALKHGIKRVVHTSTVDSLGYNPSGLADENWKIYNYANSGYNYADTKREGERIALSYVNKGLDVVVINPGSMLGPYDHTLQFGRLFMDIRDKKVPGILPGGAPWAHVAQVAKAHISALEKGRPGERYICGGVNETYKTLFTLIAEAMGVKPPGFVLWPWMSVAYGYLMEFISEFTNKPPELNPGQARYMSVFPRYDSAKAIKELGFACIALKDMVQDACDWYSANGFI